MSANCQKLGAARVCLVSAGAPTPAESTPGRIVQTDVRAKCTDVYTFTRPAGVPTRVRLYGNGSGWLELRVFDETGNLVASDTLGLTDDRGLTITPKSTGKLTVKVRNAGSVDNEYVLILN